MDFAPGAAGCLGLRRAAAGSLRVDDVKKAKTGFELRSRTTVRPSCRPRRTESSQEMQPTAARGRRGSHREGSTEVAAAT